MTNPGGARHTHFLAEFTKSVLTVVLTLRGRLCDLTFFAFQVFIYRTLRYLLRLLERFASFQAGRMSKALLPAQHRCPHGFSVMQMSGKSTKTCNNFNFLWDRPIISPVYLPQTSCDNFIGHSTPIKHSYSPEQPQNKRDKTYSKTASFFIGRFNIKEQTFPQQLKTLPIKKVAIAPNPTAILKPIPAGEKQKDYTAERIFPLFILRAHPNNRVVMRPSEKFKAKAAGAKSPQA